MINMNADKDSIMSTMDEFGLTMDDVMVLMKGYEKFTESSADEKKELMARSDPYLKNLHFLSLTLYKLNLLPNRRQLIYHYNRKGIWFLNPLDSPLCNKQDPPLHYDLLFQPPDQTQESPRMDSK